MEETIVIPSPNWFHVTILGASQDGWLVYGGPSKSLCFLEPLDSIGVIDSKQRFRAHVFIKAHKEKITSVDISSEWPEKKHIITGGHDGVVKEWNIEPKHKSWVINYLHCHEEHSVQKEEVAGVCYGTQTFAVSVGTYGNICKWDLNTNVVKRYSTHLRNFKPTCISCSPHKQLHVAVGTRQGVIFVIDISGIASKLIYKIRAQDDEINRVSWCPQYSVTINKSPNKNNKKKECFTASSRMDRIRNNLEPSEALETAIAEKKATKDKSNTKQPESKKEEEEEEEEVIIPEDDMFDVYKDHEADEFGHKKYEPEDVYVKVKEDPKEEFLAECMKLKAEILKKKNEPEESIESLVEALDKAHVKETPTGDGETERESTLENQESTQKNQEQDGSGLSQDTEESNEYKHLLASVGKYGGVRIWTQTGKLLATCTVLFNQKKDQKDHKNRGPNWPTLHWFKPDSLLIADGKNQLLEANPLKIDGKNKLEYRVVHSLHRRGLYFVSSNAPRVQTPELLAGATSHSWVVWTIGQDRNVISYNMKENRKIEVFTSCGGFMYKVKSCAYDAGKVAMSAGDGSIRVWETHTTNELEDQLSSGVVASYWQNVQGVILNLAWHPTKENLLAFSTAEARVGILDASGTSEKPAKTFPNYFKQAVYSLCWGEGMDLYACGNGELALFRANKMGEKACHIPVEVEGQVWEISDVVWTQDFIVVGAINGGVALLDHKDYHVITATFVFLKMIYTVVWHPQQTTNSQEESKYKNYIAVCSIDRVNTIAILEYEDKGEGAKQIKKIQEPLSGHEGSVLQISWNPHRDAQLLSVSQDRTVRVWNVAEGECIAIFGGHSMSVLSAMWCIQPRLAGKVLSCGGDSCLRLWDIKDYPVDSFVGVKRELTKKKKLSRRAREAKKRPKQENKDDDDITENRTQTDYTEKTDENNESENAQAGTSDNVATTTDLKPRVSKTFLLPIMAKQMSKRSMSSVRTILTKYIEEHEGIGIADVLTTEVSRERGLAFLKMFGTLNDVNELLDVEAEYHLKASDWQAYLMLLFYRGRVDEMIQFASENDLIDPYLLCLSPSVSFKYWKDTTRLYLAQLDRMAAKQHEDKIRVFRFYGGIIFRKATALLSMHDLRGCIEVLMESFLYKEAYILCRLRHMDSIAEEVLQKWADVTSSNGSLMMATILHLIRKDVSEAAITLGRSNQINYLMLAAQLAKLAGHHTFATHIEIRVRTRECQMGHETEDDLDELPTRVEALWKGNYIESEDSDEEICVNTETVNGNGIGAINTKYSIIEPSAVPNGNATKKTLKPQVATKKTNLVEDVASANVDLVDIIEPN